MTSSYNNYTSTYNNRAKNLNLKTSNAVTSPSAKSTLYNSALSLGSGAGTYSRNSMISGIDNVHTTYAKGTGINDLRTSSYTTGLNAGTSSLIKSTAPYNTRLSTVGPSYTTDYATTATFGGVTNLDHLRSSVSRLSSSFVQTGSQKIDVPVYLTTEYVEKPVIHTVEKIVDRIIPQIQTVERIHDKPVYHTNTVENIIDKPVYHTKTIEKIVDRVIDKPVIHTVEKLVDRVIEKPVYHTQTVEKIIERPVHKIQTVEKLVDRPVYHTQTVEKIIDRPVTKIQTVEKVVERVVPKIEYRDNIIQRTVDKPVYHTQTVEKIIERPVVKTEIVEKIVDRPVYRTVENVIYNNDEVNRLNGVVSGLRQELHLALLKPAPVQKVEKIVDRIVDKPVYHTQVVEKIVDKPVHQVQYVEKIVEKPIIKTEIHEKIVEKPVVHTIEKTIHNHVELEKLQSSITQIREENEEIRRRMNSINSVPVTDISAIHTVDMRSTSRIVPNTTGMAGLATSNYPTTSHYSTSYQNSNLIGTSTPLRSSVVLNDSYSTPLDYSHALRSSVVLNEPINIKRTSNAAALRSTSVGNSSLLPRNYPATSRIGTYRSPYSGIRDL